MDRTKGKHGTHMTACIAVLLAAALLLGGCGTAVPAPTPEPTEAPTPEPTATPEPEPMTREEQIIASMEEDLRAIATEDREITLEALTKSYYDVVVNGRHIETRVLFWADWKEGAGIYSGPGDTEEVYATFDIVAASLLRAVLTERDMDYTEASEAYREWFYEAFSQTNSMIEKEIDGYHFTYGFTEDLGWTLIIDF